MKCALDNLSEEIRRFKIDTEYVIIKPNWVSNNKGSFTESIILDKVMQAFPNQKKIVIESYTPWRGHEFSSNQKSLENGKECWQLYKEQDKKFLEETGISRTLNLHDAKYINITDRVWNNHCVEPEVIKNLVESERNFIKWGELYSYIPKELFDIKDKSTLISLSKIKTEPNIPEICVSMSVKNLFGLIPHPSRRVPFHGKDHKVLVSAIKDIYTIYTSIFETNFWITEGVITMIKDNEGPNFKILEDQKLLFLGKDGRKVDSETADYLGIDPKTIKHIQR